MSSRNNIEDIYPLSPMQQGILFHTLYAPASGVYCEQWNCTLHGHLQVAALQHAWQRVVERHPVLRTAFHWENRAEPFQVVYRRVEVPWQQYDWRNLSTGEQGQRLEAFLAADREQGFALSIAPLIRLTLIQMVEDVYQFVWTHHHLLLDGWSVPLLLKKVFQFYDAFCAGQELHLEMCRPYGDYIAWLQRQDLSQAEAFWRQTLQGFTTPTSLLVGRVASIAANQEASYAEQQKRLSATLTETLQALARRHHLSVNTLVQGAWAVLLSRYSGEEDVVFGAVVSGRLAALVGVESMVGLFMNTLPVRVRVSPEASLLPWLQALQAQQVEARHYEYSPLVHVQRWSNVPPGLPLFDTLFVFENYPGRATIQEWVSSLEIRQVRFVPRTHYPLTVLVIPEPALVLRLSYQCPRFDSATITQMLGHLQILLEGIVADPGQRLADLPLLTQAEHQQLLVAWNNTHAAYPHDMCVHQMFEAQVERIPDTVAVVFEDQALTYRELNTRANRLAHHLRALGVGPEVLVGLCVERSLELMVGLLGILKAGGAYVPLDPTYPPARLAFMLADAQVSVLVTQQQWVARLPVHGLQVVCLDGEWEHLASQPGNNPVSGVIPANLAYVMYTSGSTGQPKGVMVEHWALSNTMHWMQATFPLSEADRVLQKTPSSFDVSAWEFFAPLMVGAQLILARPGEHQDSAYIVDLLATHQITMLQLVPSLLQMVLEEEALATCHSLRHVFCAGEALTHALQERFFARLTADLHNLYGPTEATIYATYWTCVRGSPSGHVPIGWPIANTQLYILDTQLHPVPIGVPGELHIGGVGLARGYLNHPELTAERFIPHPFSDVPGARLYKTGDLARYRPDGSLEFLGRRDTQIKLRGYRIELGEIEATLEHHPAIRQAVVLAREDTAGDRRLVAYCVSHHGFILDIRELRSFLQIKLPDYMVPAAFVVLDALPLTANGKVDRQALPTPGKARPPLFEAFVAPRTPIEELLASIWANVLKVESVGIHDNFFALGGHSLLAVQVISRLRKVFQVDVPLRVLFDAPTVAGLARHVEKGRQAAQSTPAPPLKAMPREGVVPLTMTQEHFWDLDQLLPGAPFSNMLYAARLTGPLNVKALEQSFNEIIKRHETLRTTFTTIAGQPVQVIAPTLHLPLEMDDLRALPEAAREAAAHQLICAEVLYPFDLEKGPLLQVRLLRLGEQEHILLLTMHHIISDGWSWGVLLHELTVLYEAFSQGHPSPLPELPVQYAHYAHWQRQWLQSEAGKAQLTYWMQQLHAPLSILQLPTDRPRTGEMSLRTARRSFHLPKELTTALTQLSRQENTTLFMTLVAGLKMMLYGYTGQEDIRVGTLVANRQDQDTEGLIGLFANLTILRTNLGGNPSLRQVLQRVRTTTLDAYAHQELPFEYLARALVHTRQCDRQSLFQVIFAMQNARQHTLALPALTVQPLETKSVEASSCDLAVSVRESPQGLEGLCIYKTAMFDTPTITRRLEDFQRVLTCLIADPELRLSTFRTRRE
jgi:amino acid adenylation domain-containing protein